MNLARQSLIVAALGALVVAGWFAVDPMAALDAGGSERKRGLSTRPAAIVVREVALGVESVRAEAVGTASARRSATLFAASAGAIQAINFRADDLVARGDVLLELEREAEELAVELAAIRLADAERAVERLRRLSASGAAAQARLEEALSDLEAARIELRRAEVALAERFVIAPFGGRIGMTEFDIGDRIGPDSAIATLDDRARLLVRFAVPEALLGRVAIADSVEVTPWSADRPPLTARVFDVASRVSPETRTFPVRAEIPNARDRLRPGMSFRVTLALSGARYPKVPEIAIRWGGEGAYLWAVVDGVGRRVPVAIVQRQADGVLVDGDVEAGALVVVEGLHRMRDGVPVEILSDAPAPPAPVPAQLRDSGS